LVSDPGFRLVGAARETGHPVFPIPGASSLLAALVASGLPTDTFLFAGFLPVKPGPRMERLRALATTPATLVFFESPQRLAASLPAMVEAYGAARPAAVARELTKVFETVVTAPLSDLVERFAGEPPKGEIVILVGPPPERAAASADDADAILAALLADHAVGEAATEAAAITGLPRRDLYRRALSLKGKSDGNR
jgi:16S rRNA (cytidine1402-2'-O)-methyltransferase